MDVTTILLTYQRPKVLADCLHSLINNTEIVPKEFWILDDGSEKTLQMNLLLAAREMSDKYTPTHVVFAGKNRGIGYNFEQAYNLMRMSESDGIFSFVEADYIWRQKYLEDILAVFEASPWTIAVAGTNHMDMYDDRKTCDTFPTLMKEQFCKDLEQRAYLYKHFNLQTARGDIQVQGVSNSCGCQFVHWGRLKALLAEMDLETRYWQYLDRAFHKNGTGERRYASDAHMSGTLTMFAEQHMLRNNIDITKNFGMLSISDYSISSHLCGGGVNGGIVPEGHTFVYSPTWDAKYLEIDPRNTEPTS